jgi:glycosyltransferase involved in cell wall biosynthesis
MRQTYHRADGVIAISCGVADDLAAAIDMPRDHIQVIYNPAFLPNVIENSKLALLHPWFAPHEPPVILAAGRLTAAKDFSTLIRAFARLHSVRAARLVILGEGEQRDKLEVLLKELDLASDVALPGFVDNPFAWMRRSALFVLSSAWEGFGNVLVEAMACGLPVVSTDCPSGPAEILENGRWGRLVPVGDVEALAAAMCATLDESEHPNVAARAAMFHSETAVEKYLKVLGFGT